MSLDPKVRVKHEPTQHHTHKLPTTVGISIYYSNTTGSKVVDREPPARTSCAA